MKNGNRECVYCLFYDLLLSLWGGNDLYTKEEIFLTNYSFSTSSMFEYTHMTINQSPVEHFENYIGLLQNSVTSFIHFIEESLIKVVHFFEGVSKTDYINGLEEIFLLSRENFKAESLKLQYNINNKLSKKRIDAKNYEMLNHIINAHHRMAIELIEKEITTDRIEIISNYLREVIIYVKTDFKIDQLPDVETQKSALTFEAHNNEEMIIENYGLGSFLDIDVGA